MVKMIYQLYGFNLLYDYKIKNLEKYIRNTIDEELPVVEVLVTDSMEDCVDKAVDINGEHAKAKFSERLCLFELVDGSKIQITKEKILMSGENMNQERVGNEINGPTIIILSRYHHRAILHGSAFMYKGKAYLILASPGFGKSTLTTAMIKNQEEIEFLTDDIICVSEDGTQIFNAIHSVNLNDDSLNVLQEILRRQKKVDSTLNIYSEKTTCDLNLIRNGKQNTVPLGGIMILSDPINKGTIKIEELDNVKALFEIVKHIKMRTTITSSFLTQEMGIINKMIRNGEFVVKMQIEHDYNKLETITGLIKEYIDINRRSKCEK